MTVDVRSASQPEIYPETYAAPAGPVGITPTRHHIDDRFPVLAFTVDTGGRPFFEVLLTTDRALFDPASAGRRNASNFFASREHGLLRSGNEPAVYHVPPAVLQAFASAREIFYTAVAYDDQQATNGAYALAPQMLAREAPSVTVAPGFRGRTMGSMLGVSVEKLLRVRDDTTSPVMAAATAAIPRSDSYSDASWSLEADAEDDRVGGEDGYGESAAIDDDEPERYGAVYDAQPFDAPPSNEEYGDEAPEAQPMDAAPDGDGYGDSDYSDGFEGPVETLGASPAESSRRVSAYGDEAEWTEDPVAAQESTFPAGAAPPEMLEDDDERRYESGSEEESQPLGIAYDDEIPDVQPLGDTSTEPLTPQRQVQILQLIARQFESAQDGYSAINADGEFAGRITGHPATGNWHVGLSWGFIQFTQDSGGLGAVLTAMQQRDPTRFREIFGPDSDALLRVTNASGPGSRQTPPRGSRVQPVGGRDLWEEPWLSRFRTAGAHPAFQSAQNEIAARHYIAPILAFARDLGLTSQRALAMIVDRAIQMGTSGARTWILDAVTPIPTDALRASALHALGHSDLASFQRAANLTADGNWGPRTHTALVAALRALPPGRSPVPIPNCQQMLEMIVRRAGAQQRSWARRPEWLRTTTELSDDVVFSL